MTPRGLGLALVVLALLGCQQSVVLGYASSGETGGGGATAEVSAGMDTGTDSGTGAGRDASMSASMESGDSGPDSSGGGATGQATSDTGMGAGDDGPDEDSETSDSRESGGSCAVAEDASPCNACAQSMCCEELEACSTEAECGCFVSCLDDASPQACQMQCGASAATAALRSCLGEACEAECDEPPA